MNIFIENHQKLLACLIQHEVNFMLVGGYAVIFHGNKRTTGDMDVWIEPDNDNKMRLLDALRTFDFNEDDVKHIANLDFTKYIAFHFWEEPERVDCITYISNVTFTEAFQAKMFADIKDLKVPAIHYTNLIQSKITTDRLNYRADVGELQKLDRYRN
jgi:hypothetical protein